MDYPEDIYNRKEMKKLTFAEKFFFMAILRHQYVLPKNGYNIPIYYRGTEEDLMNYLDIPRSSFYRIIAKLKDVGRLKVVDSPTQKQPNRKEWRLITFWTDEDIKKKSKKKSNEFGNNEPFTGDNK